MCLHLCCLNFLQLLLVLSYKLWSQSLLLIVVASFNSSLSNCCLISRIFLSISRTELVLKHCSIAKCTHFSFQQVFIRSKLISNNRVMSIIAALQSVPTNFRTRNIQCSCHISLYGSSNSLILDALEREFHGASEYQLFLPCMSLYMVKFYENSGPCSRTLEMLTNLIYSLITNSWERFVMPAKQFKCTVYPPR